ncbi:hypothetical protein BU17DRAFT_80297 [Hysterangium stoloniferum]|nr:hypothetical protein BU17DRAFT_80297 [Hysterangium stoloniferum]
MSSDESPPPFQTTPTHISDFAPYDDRRDLMIKARAFLQTPTVRSENEAAKRQFLADKGLNATEIDNLLQEASPPIPPRTYPLAPPSNLPYLLVSLLRIFTWGVGVSGVLILIYHRYLLPRVTRSLTARHNLKLHQIGLLSRFKIRLEAFKNTQQDTFDALPPPQPDVFPPDIKSLEGISVDADGIPSQPLGTLLRAAFLGEPGQKYTVDELHTRLLRLFPALGDDNEGEFKRAISRQLSRSGLFFKIPEGELEHWTLNVDTNSKSIPVVSSTSILEALRSAIARGVEVGETYQHTFKSLTDFTAFLSKETFDLYGNSLGFRHAFSGARNLSPAQEDVRREIRALKGLVLNRRSFVPSPNRTASHSAITQPTQS